FTHFLSQPVPKHDAFHRAFQRLTPQTLQEINELVLQTAIELGLEDGTKLRVDCTVVQTDIHHPTDSTLLWDSVRVLTRLVGRLGPATGQAFPGFRNRTRAARRRMQAIQRMTRPATETAGQEISSAHPHYRAGRGKRRFGARANPQKQGPGPDPGPGDCRASPADQVLS